MAGYKETTRQKMISMMYLVLYTLLALNVSKQVLDAFVVVNKSIEVTNKNLSQRLDDIYSGFEKEYQFNPGKVKPYWEKAKQARALSSDLLNYINQVKDQVISKTERIPIDSAKVVPVRNLSRKDDYETPTNFFLGNTDDGKSGMAIKLKSKIDDFRKNMLNLVDKSQFRDINSNLSTSGPYYNADNQKQNWQLHFFYNTILAADITILNKFRSDVYNAEYEVLDYLYKSIGKGNFKFDKIEAKVLPNSNFVFLGDNYRAEIVVAAYDTSSGPKVYFMNGVDSLPADQYQEATLLSGQPGKMMIDVPARKLGVNKYAGFVRERSATGAITDYHFSGEYIVSRPLLSVSPKKMNTFYIGVSNPVSIAIAGIPAQYLIPTISCGTIKKDPSGNDWVVDIPPGNKLALIKVYAIINGERRQLGSKMFRVKKLPTPIATIGGRSSGGVDKEIMLAAGALVPRMPDDFEFDQTFSISSFTMTLQRGWQVYHYNSNNEYLTVEMRDQIKRTNRGMNIIFENIIARDPNGINRKLAPIILTIE
jgi:gliding motility-associated protein GldM